MKNVGTSVKVFSAAKTKFAVVFTLISLAFGSQAFAVLRPLFPGKPAPPFNGELIIIGDDLMLGSAKKRQEIRNQWDKQIMKRTNPTMKAHLIRGALLLIAA